MRASEGLFRPRRRQLLNHLEFVIALIDAMTNSYFSIKIMPKKQKIAELCFYFEFQVVVAVVGFKWHERGKAKNAD